MPEAPPRKSNHQKHKTMSPRAWHRTTTQDTSEIAIPIFLAVRHIPGIPICVHVRPFLSTISHSRMRNRTKTHAAPVWHNPNIGVKQISKNKTTFKRVGSRRALCKSYCNPSWPASMTLFWPRIPPTAARGHEFIATYYAGCASRRQNGCLEGRFGSLGTSVTSISATGILRYGLKSAILGRGFESA